MVPELKWFFSGAVPNIPFYKSVWRTLSPFQSPAVQMLIVLSEYFEVMQDPQLALVICAGHDKLSLTAISVVSFHTASLQQVRVRLTR